MLNVSFLLLLIIIIVIIFIFLSLWLSTICSKDLFFSVEVKGIHSKKKFCTVFTVYDKQTVIKHSCNTALAVHFKYERVVYFLHF